MLQLTTLNSTTSNHTVTLNVCNHFQGSFHRGLKTRLAFFVKILPKIIFVELSLVFV